MRLLPKSEKEIVYIDDKIKLEYAKLKETHTGAIILDEKQVVYVSNNDTGSKKQNKKNKKDDANDATKIDNTGNALLAFTLLKNTKSNVFNKE